MKKIIYNEHQNQAIYHKKIFNNNSVLIRKSKATLTLKKPAYIGMCILHLSEV